MASLTITIGALTATISANNTKATDILNAYAESLGASGTNQERANAVLLGLVRHMREQARRYRSNGIIVQAIDNAQVELDGLDWS